MKINPSIIAIGLSSLFALQTTTTLQAATITKSVGDTNFGASLTGTFDQYGWFVSNASYGYVATLSGSANGKILSKSVTLASGSAKLAINNTSGSQLVVNLKAGGRSLIDNWTVASNGYTAYVPPSFKVTGPGVDAWYGPFHVTAKAEISVSAVGTYFPEWSSSGGFQATARFGPVVDASVVATAGVGVPLVAEIGVEGKLRLCRAGLGASFTLVPNGGHPYANFATTFETGAPSGYLKAYADVGKLTAWGYTISPGYRLYEYRIASFSGGSTFYNILPPARFAIN